ncbi:GerMN domain-containing protein [Geminocystis sp. CENA526]|uniref:GerMN domain-containing protein n=1 Tax=Geminocystis sp. CENA526 TaxID=1355871 RepID=UPI003D6E9872
MTDNHDRNPLFSTKTIAGIATTILALGTIAGWYAYGNFTAKNQGQNQPIEIIPEPAVSESSIELYGLNEELELVPTIVEIKKGQNEQESLTLGFNKLLTVSENDSIKTAIPQETKLISLAVKDDGIHLDLSQEFTSGGGSASMIGRLGQVIYTASSLNPSGNVWINVEGKPLDILGEEGLMIEQPMTRELFMESFPSN